jgi:hypothetical protein
VTAGLHRACRLLGLIPSRHGCRRRAESLAPFPLADPNVCRPEDLVPFAAESRTHPYERTPQ